VMCRREVFSEDYTNFPGSGVYEAETLLALWKPIQRKCHRRRSSRWRGHG
jgi:hypothetical protein